MRIEVAQQLSTEFRKLKQVQKGDTPLKRGGDITDQSSISPKAQQLHDSNAVSNSAAAIATNQPEIREEKIAEIRQKIADGFYNSPEFIDSLAKKLLSDFGVKE